MRAEAHETGAREPRERADAADARILLVDDEPQLVRLLGRTLREAGYADVRGCSEPREALALFDELRPDLVVLDLWMPGRDGLSLIAEIRGRAEPGDYLPILVLTADRSREASRRALAAGAMDFLTKPPRAAEALLRIHNLLETRLLHRRLRAQNESLEARVRERTEELEAARVEVLERLARAAEFRDDLTGGHTRRVGELAERLARTLGLPEDEVEVVRRAAPLHDVGKIGLPDSILLNPGRLTPEEFERGKSHTWIGAGILAGSGVPTLQVAERVALHHHERWDGSGYPHGLRDEEIPLCARIVAVADVYDALTSARPYKAAWSPPEARAEIRRLAGRQFDPRVVEAMMSYEL
jgi:putative two-component system response regulator